MINLFRTSEKMKYIFANLYYLQNKAYFAVEKENKFFFCQQNGKLLEEIAVFSMDTHFICNALYTNIYAIEIIEEQLKINSILEQKEYFFKLSSVDEFIIGLTAGQHSLLIKTCRDLSDDEQEIKMYYIDVKAEKIIFCDDVLMKESYHMPYISTCGDEEFVLVESAVIDPYEIDEAKKNTSFIYNNDILTLRLQELRKPTTKNGNLKWNVIFSAKEGYYITLLQVKGAYLWFLETTVDETKTNIVKYNLNNDLVENSLYVEDRIDKVVFNGNNLLCMYKWNSSKEIIDIYSDQGVIVSQIDYSSLMNQNNEIELNEVLAILDERYIIFDATDYSSDESYQCRVIYDIINNQFMLYNNPYVQFNGLFY